MIKELVQVQVRVQGLDQVGAALVALGGRHAGAGVHASVIDTLQPEGELGVEFFEAAGALAGQAQTGFKILLDREKYPLGFTLAPGMVGFCMEQTDTQVGAHDASMVISERGALVGLEFGGQTRAEQGIPEVVGESAGRAIWRGGPDEPGLVRGSTFAGGESACEVGLYRRAPWASERRNRLSGKHTTNPRGCGGRTAAGCRRASSSDEGSPVPGPPKGENPGVRGLEFG